MVRDYIAQTLESLLSQTEKNFEIILVDDGTKDDSIEIAVKLLTGSDVQYSVIRQENLGVSAARNAGMKQAGGEWIICMDPDDCIHPRTFEFIHELIAEKENNVEIVAFNYMLYSSNNFEYHQYKAHVDYEWIESNKAMELYADRSLRIITPGLCIKRSICEEKGFYYDPKIIYSEDTLYIWDILLRTKGIWYIDTPLYYYLMRPGSTMTSSGIPKIMNGYDAYIKFCKEIDKKYRFKGQEFILARWVFGVLHQAAHYMDIKTFRELTEKLQYRGHMKKLVHYSKLSIRLCVMIMLIIGPNIYYILKMR